MGKPTQMNFLPLLGWAGVAVVAVMAIILNIPDPPLDWENFVLPMTNQYMGLNSSDDTYSKTPLLGVNIVISGATAGIGRGLVENIVKLGGNVIAIGRNPDKLEALKNEFNSITTVVADYNDLDTVAKAADEIIEKFEHIDILINNAGIHEGIILLHNPISKQGYDRIFSVNYLAHVLLTEKLAPSLAKSERPVVAQMSSSFHWVGDWSDLIPGENGEPPRASRPGGVGFVFRTQRGYGDTKLALIFNARALKRRNPHLQKARVVSVCPGWVGTNIMERLSTIGHLAIGKLGFKYNGWGVASTLYGVFSQDDPEADYFSNTRALNVVSIRHMEIAHAPFTFAFGLRDLGSFALAFAVMGVQKLMPIAESGISSPVTYNERLQDQIYDWSKQAVADWI